MAEAREHTMTSSSADAAAAGSIHFCRIDYLL